MPLKNKIYMTFNARNINFVFCKFFAQPKEKKHKLHR